MYCRPKKFLPACWHLSSVLLESEVWVRPAQVGALFLHNLRVCLTFWHVMNPQTKVAIFLHKLRVCWLFWPFEVSIVRRGSVQGDGSLLWRLLGPWEHKRSCVQTWWCAGETPATETLAMSLTWGCQWLVRLGVLFVPPIYKTYLFFHL
jgi:hypothetical protein